MDECNLAFNRLKAALTSAPILVFPNFDWPFHLYTDTSKMAIGAVLSQKDKEGHNCMVVHVSCCLSKTKKNYSVMEWECLAIVYWIEYFHHYLHGSKFFIITNHTALCWLMEAREQQGCLVRWAMKLQPYDFEICHCAGEKHTNANTMSRPPVVWRLTRSA